MIKELFDAIRVPLATRWEARLPTMIADTRNIAAAIMRSVVPKKHHTDEVEDAIRRAFLAGSRQAYWEGVRDFVDAAIDLELQAEDVLSDVSAEAFNVQ